MYSPKTRGLVLLAMLQLLSMSVCQTCVPVNAPDYGTCAGLDGDCCDLWMLDCALGCGNDALGVQENASSAAGLPRKFSCRGQTVQYTCKCEGDECPSSYCESSQCLQSNGSEYSCDLECSPQENDVLCPEGKIPRFAKSFPTCPQHTKRYACKHFTGCQSVQGQSLVLPAAPAHPTGPAPRGMTRGLRRDKSRASRLHGSASTSLMLVGSLLLASAAIRG